MSTSMPGLGGVWFRRFVACTENRLPFSKIQLNIETTNEVSKGDLDRLAAEVAKFCPLAKLFRQAGTVIDENWVSGPA